MPDEKPELEEASTLELGDELVLTDESNKEHTFNAVGEIDVSFEDEKEPSKYFICTKDEGEEVKENADVLYIVVDPSGKQLEDDEKADVILQSFVDHIKKEFPEDTSEEKK
jgi:uncharacterized protein YrzB (UPF0473 family)